MTGAAVPPSPGRPGVASAPTRAAAALARYGFGDAGAAGRLLADPVLALWDGAAGRPTDPAAGTVLEALGEAADPDLAARQLHRLVEAAARDGDATALLAALRDDDGLRSRLLAVLGASTALGDHLVAQPADWRLLTEAPAPRDADTFRREMAAVVGVDPAAPVCTGTDGAHAEVTGVAAVTALRLAYRRALLVIAAADLTRERDVAEVATELSDLADATLAAALAVAAAELPAGTAPARFAVVAMGKCGGRELNYVSDVDVIYLAAAPADAADSSAGALATATRLAVRLADICRQVAWPVDAALRPEGKDGPLVRTLDSYRAYYQKWARTWEFQALLKARPAAGDRALAAEWEAMVRPLVWQAADRPGVVDDVRAMRRRVEAHLPAREREYEIKRGVGGLRDIEFAVQLLQLVHGRADETLRHGATLDALAALTDGGYVGRKVGETLARSYRFLRTVEHRLQLQYLRRTHRIPDDADERRWLANALGYRATADRPDPVAAFLGEWTAHAREVRRLYERLLYRPVLDAVAKVPSDDLRLTPEAARQRLEVLGFADPAGALRHIQSLTGGVSRTAAIQRTLLPVLLGEFADAPEPDRGLLAYRQVSEKLGRTPWYLRLLRDEGPVALRMARLLGLSRYVAELLARDPEALRLLAADGELTPRPREVLTAGFAAAAARHDVPESAIAAIRALRRRELLRIACADALGQLGAEAVGVALTDVTDAVIAAALRAASRAAGVGEDTVRLAVIGMGRFGGGELSYASDADVLFVHQPAPGVPEEDAARAARIVAEQLTKLLAAPAPDPPLGLDAALRPEGRQGPLSRSLAGYTAYYARWSHVWEAQALLRARFVAGDQEVGGQFTAIIDPVRYPPGGLSPAEVTEIRRIKARVDNERLPRGADPATHTKLGRGGLADVEWAIQLVQLQHAHDVPALRTPATLAALTAAVAADLITPTDAQALRAGWLRATQVRNAMTLVRGRPSDQLPRHGPDLAGVASLVPIDSHPPAESTVDGTAADHTADPGEFLDSYLRTTRLAHQAVERVFLS